MKIQLLSLFLLALSSVGYAAPVSDVEKAPILPKNELSNPGAENLTAGWSATGVAVGTTSTAANVGAGKRAFSWDSSAASQILSSPTVSIIGGLASSNGVASCRIKANSGAPTHLLQVYDGTSILISQTIAATTDRYQRTSVNFQFPASGSVRIRVVSVASNEPLIFIDDCYLGLADGFNTLMISQATKMGSITTPGAAGCNWTTGDTAAAYTPFGADDPDCATFTLTGSALAPATVIPGIRFATLPPGKYKVVAQGLFAFESGAVDASMRFRIHDGTNGLRGVSNVEVNTAANIKNLNSMVMGEIDYTTAQSNVTFQLQGLSTTDSNDPTIQNDVTYNEFTIAVYKYPSDQEMGFRPDIANWRLEAKQGKNPLASLGIGTSAGSHTPIIITGLEILNNYGNVPARQLCDNAAVTGSTCAGDGVIGIEFTPPRAGSVRACVQFSHFIATTGSNGSTFFRLDQLNSISTTIVTAGKQGHYAGESASGGINTNSFSPIRFCENLSLTSVSPIYLGLTQQILSTAGGNEIMDNGIIWTVEPIDQQIPAPALVNSVVSPLAGVMNVVTVEFAGNLAGSAVCNSDPCVIRAQSGGVSSVSYAPTANYQINFIPGTFSSPPVCVFSSLDIVSGIIATGTTRATTTEVGMSTFNAAGAQADDGATAICIGPK